MKSLKVAAVIAGSLAVVGAAAPAFADGLTPTSLNGGLDEIAANGLRSGSPLNTNALDPQNSGSVVNSVGHAANSLGGSNGAGSLLGGLPLGG